MESLEMLANNLANASTAGYKSDREFYSLYVAPEAVAAFEAGQSTRLSTLPVIERHWTDFSQGTLTPTGNPLDLALSGKGFFVVVGPRGPLYTRNRGFRLSPQGVLETQEGYPVRTVLEGSPERVIRAEPSPPLEVSAEGTVRQRGQVLGRLEIVDFPEPGIVNKHGRNYFRLVDPKAAPVAAALAEVQQARLESSNFGAAEAAVRLVSIMRQFEMLQKTVQLSAEMNRRALEEVARVSP